MSEEPKDNNVASNGGYGPFGDVSYHLPMVELERCFDTLSPPKVVGELALIVSRGERGVRETPSEVQLKPEEGIPGDAWLRKVPLNLDAQITLMRLDVARLIANGQPLTLFGDNLLVDLDLSLANLPPGSRLRVGGATLEVTPEPHNGCLKFHQRFGKDALRLTAHRRFREYRLRGIYAKALEPGRVAVGDRIEVQSRAWRAVSRARG